METWVPVSTRIVHFTGYEIKLSQIHLADARDRKCGHLLGTADLIAQMADRCYLEKCRDRLYPEFVLGGVAAAPRSDGTMQVRYSSGLDLLRQTPGFVRDTRKQRLDGEFEQAYQFAGAAVRRRQSVPRSHRPQHGLPAADSARGALAHAAPKSPAVHHRGGRARSGARLDGDRLKALWAKRPAACAAGPSRPVDARDVAGVQFLEPLEHVIFARERASRSASRSNAGVNARRAGSATGAKLKCHGSGSTPDNTPRNGRKKPKRAALVSSHAASGANGPDGAYSSAIKRTRYSGVAAPRSMRSNRFPSGGGSHPAARTSAGSRECAPAAAVRAHRAVVRPHRSPPPRR